MKDFLLKESVMISVLSILSFVAAYLFECGYADAFGYAHTFIEIDLKIMVISIFCVALALFPLFLYFWVFLSFGFKREKEPRLVALKMIVPIPVLIFFYITGFESKIMKWLLIVSALLALWTFIRVVYKARKLGWKQAVSEMAIAQGLKDFEGPRPKGGEPRVIDKIIAYCVMVLVLVAVGLMVRGVGGGVAHWKSNYQTFILDGEEVAILAAYGERVIVGGVTGDQFNTKLTVVPKDSEKLVDLKQAFFDGFLSEKLYLQ